MKKLLITLLSLIPLVYSNDIKPNFIIIFTDDQGYGDLSCFNPQGVQTPHIDQMATEGMKFNNFYVSAAVCSASRAALLTGTYNDRIGIKSAFFPGTKQGLHPDEITIAELLKEQNYATACFGKWHLGDEPSLLPSAQGFDTYFGIPYSNDMFIAPHQTFAENAKFNGDWTLEKAKELQKFIAPHVNKRGPIWKSEYKALVPILEGEQIVEFPAEQASLTQRYFDRTIKFIDKNQNKPFFIFLTPAMPHVPLFASKEFRGKSKKGLYGDVIKEIDFHTGRLIKHLKEKELDQNTLVIFTSDNGPWLSYGDEGGSSGPLRDGKFTSYEGGVRMPTVFWGPGLIKANSVCNQLASTIDLLPTFAQLVNTQVPQDRKIDGKDISPLLKSQNHVIHRHLFFRDEAVRSGDWKLVVKEHHMTMRKGPLPALYNLKNDVAESNNLIDTHPKVAQYLQSKLDEHLKDLNENSRPMADLNE